MRHFYWEEADEPLNGGPLTHIVYENKEDESSIMFCWTYSQDEAEFIVDCLNKSQPISALSHEVITVIETHLENLTRYGKDLEAKVLYYSAHLEGEEQEVFEKYFHISKEKDGLLKVNT